MFTWLDQNARLFKTMVNTLGITAKSLPAKTKGTLLVPSDQVTCTSSLCMSEVAAADSHAAAVLGLGWACTYWL